MLSRVSCCLGWGNASKETGCSATCSLSAKATGETRRRKRRDNVPPPQGKGNLRREYRVRRAPRGRGARLDDKASESELLVNVVIADKRKALTRLGQKAWGWGPFLGLEGTRTKYPPAKRERLSRPCG